VLLENLQQIRFNRVNFTTFRVKVWKILFLSGFCCWKFKQIAKNGFGRKNQLSLQCVHTWANGICYISLLTRTYGSLWIRSRNIRIFHCIGENKHNLKNRQGKMDEGNTLALALFALLRVILTSTVLYLKMVLLIDYNNEIHHFLHYKTSKTLLFVSFD
jgi:hypothetical protein